MTKLCAALSQDVEQLVETLSITTQDSANAVRVNTFRSIEKNAKNVLRHLSDTCAKQFLKVGSAAENIFAPCLLPCDFFSQKLFWASDEGFKIASYVVLRA